MNEMSDRCWIVNEPVTERTDSKKIVIKLAPEPYVSGVMHFIWRGNTTALTSALRPSKKS